MFNKTKKYLKSLHYELSEKFKWHKRHFELKHPFMLYRLFQTTKTIFAVSVCIFIFLAFMYKTKIIVVENNSIMFDIYKTFDNINMSGIITSQISVTMIVVSIISLIASTENKYILGKRAIELVFPKRFFNSFSIYLIILFLLAFLNIYFLMNKFGDSLILTDFILSILIVAYFVYRFASIFVNQNKIKNKLKYRYYKDNLKHIKKAKPLFHHISKSIDMFKNITIRHIRENNVPVYCNNIDVHFIIIESTLFNHKHLVQDYYADNYEHYDLISNILQFAQELLEKNKTKESLLLYNRLCSTLNYYQVINVSDVVLYNLSSKYIEAIKQMNNETEIEEYSYILIGMIKQLNYQIYLYSKLDLSYCRLYKSNLIHFWTSNSLLEKYYLSIYENKFLNSVEKIRLYIKLLDDIRMMDLTESINNYNIDDFNNRKNVHDNKDVYPIEIVTEPISLMILKMFENKDEENILLFWRNNNKIQYAINTFVVLPITESILRKRKVFRIDLDIDTQFATEVLKKIRIFNLNIDISKWSELYKVISEKYTLSDSKFVSGSYYGFCPKFAFSRNVVDTYFLFIAERFNQKEQFIKNIGMPNIEKDILVEQQIKKYINQ